MYPIFVYIPAEGEKKGFWLNLANVFCICEGDDGELMVDGAMFTDSTVSGQQARHLRAALDNQTRPQTLAEKYPALSAWAERREPQLPNLPDPVVVPPAVTEFNDKITARGTVA